MCLQTLHHGMVSNKENHFGRSVEYVNNILSYTNLPEPNCYKIWASAQQSCLNIYETN